MDTIQQRPIAIERAGSFHIAGREVTARGIAALIQNWMDQKGLMA